MAATITDSSNTIVFPSITTSTNLGPLTPTSFPSGCLSTLWDLNTPALGIAKTYVTQGCAVSTCCPSGNFYTADFGWMSSYYSPGWCPSQYRECPPPRGSTSLKTSNGESIAFCCPTNYACPSTASRDIYQFCQSLYSGTTEVVVLNNIFDQKTMSAKPIDFPTGPNPHLAVYPIQIRRRPGQAIPIVEPASTSAPSAPNLNQSKTETSGNGSLSGGAIAGIVIGTVVGLLIIALLIWIALILRRRAKSSQSSESPPANVEVTQTSDLPWESELPASQSQNRESYQTKFSGPALVELEGSEGGTELPQKPHER